MWIILLGAPGAGKGTQAERICRDFKVSKISTGDMLRAEIAAGTKIGQAFKQIIENGQLGSDEMVVELVKKRLEEIKLEQRKSGQESRFLFDGFPRTLQQAKALETLGIVIDYVICIDVSDQEIVGRLGGRRIHLASGRTYHIKFHPDERDDLTGEPLVQRKDDREEVVKRRLKIYHQETEPLIKWYQEKALQFVQIPGDDSIEDVWERIKETLRVKMAHLEKE